MCRIPLTRHGMAGQAGFSLVELMVSIALGLIILAAVLTLYLNVNRNNQELARANSQIENGRFAIQLIQSDLAHAGYWGGYLPRYDDLAELGTPSDAPTAIPDPCLAYASWDAVYKTNLLGIPVQGYEIPSPVPSPTLSVCSSIVVSPKANTDVLVVRHADTCVPGVGSCEADTAGKLYFQSSYCNTESATPYVLATTGYDRHNRDCTTVADKRKFVSNLYYIRDYASTAGDGIPTLMRSSFDLSGSSLAHQAAQPLIEGIEGFRVEFGIDSLSETGAAVNLAAAINWQDPDTKNTPTNRGDGVPDGDFVRCTSASPCNVAQLTNAVAAKIYILARNLETTPGYTDSKTYTLGATTLGPFNDGYKRHVFSTTVRLVNISSRRETP